MNNGCIAKSHRNKRILNLFKIGYSFSEITTKLKIGRGTAAGVVWRNKRKRKNEKNRNATIIKYYNKGYRYREIAIKLNISLGIVAGILWRYKRRLKKNAQTTQTSS